MFLVIKHSAFLYFPLSQGLVGQRKDMFANCLLTWISLPGSWQPRPYQLGIYLQKPFASCQQGKNLGVVLSNRSHPVSETSEINMFYSANWQIDTFKISLERSKINLFAAFFFCWWQTLSGDLVLVLPFNALPCPNLGLKMCAWRKGETSRRLKCPNCENDP